MLSLIDGWCCLVLKIFSLSWGESAQAFCCFCFSVNLDHYVCLNLALNIDVVKLISCCSKCCHSALRISLRGAKLCMWGRACLVDGGIHPQPNSINLDKIFVTLLRVKRNTFPCVSIQCLGIYRYTWKIQNPSEFAVAHLSLPSFLYQDGRDHVGVCRGDD